MSPDRGVATDGSSDECGTVTDYQMTRSERMRLRLLVELLVYLLTPTGQRIALPKDSSRRRGSVRAGVRARNSGVLTTDSPH
jgi:hypothetical protein